jgi:hypothetical protein
MYTVQTKGKKPNRLFIFSRLIFLPARCFWVSEIWKSHKGQYLANKEGQPFIVSDIVVQWPLCVTKHCNGTTWRYGDQMLVNSFWNMKNCMFNELLCTNLPPLVRESLIGKEHYILVHDLFDAHGVFCYARSLTSFGLPYFVMSLLLGLIKWTHVSSPVMIFAI